MKSITEVMQVLVADNDARVCAEVCEIADAAGMKTLSATDGQEAWEIYQTADPDIIVTEIQMPVMDGFELVARIRERSNLIQKYILMINSALQPHMEIQALNSGANAYMIKPLPFEETLVQLHMARRLLKAGRELARTARPAQPSPVESSIIALCRKEISRAERHRRALTCLIMAIENLSQFRSSNRPELREQWYAWALEMIQTRVRIHDVVDMYDDGKIGVLLPETELEKAQAVQHKLHAILEEGPFSKEEGFIHPRLKFGLARYENDQRCDFLLERAELAANVKPGKGFSRQ